MQKRILLLVLACFVASTSALIEMWWNVEGTKFGFDKYFRQNLRYQDSLPNNSEKKKQLIEYFKYNWKARQTLEDHNSKTNFIPKHLEDRVIIPYATHIIWCTGKLKKKVLDRQNIWDMVYKMGIEKKKYGVNWQHYFWTNDPSSIYINETVCEGRCHIKLFSELKHYNQVEFLVESLIHVKFYAIDFLKPYILYYYGGIYMDIDYNLEHSHKYLHSVMDFYTGSEGTFMSGVCAGVFAARKKHQAMKDWMDLLLGYYGLAADVFGARELMPMPAFRDDISWTSGPRGISFGVWNNLNKWGNNDAIFKMAMMNMDPNHGFYKYNKYYGWVIDEIENSRRESIMIGGQKYHFDQFGWQVNAGSWHLPTGASFKLEDGRIQKQYWLLDMGDKEDIQKPNYVTKDSLEEERERFADRPLVQKIYYDTWFTEYFKMQKGRYIDNMQSPTNLSNHGEIWDAGGETLDQWASETLDNALPLVEESDQIRQSSGETTDEKEVEEKKE